MGALLSIQTRLFIDRSKRTTRHVGQAFPPLDEHVDCDCVAAVSTCHTAEFPISRKHR